MNNLAYDEAYRAIREDLAERMKEYLVKTEDPRQSGRQLPFDDYEYYGRKDWKTNPFPYIYH
jgi:hypothetical protein